MARNSHRSGRQSDAVSYGHRLKGAVFAMPRGLHLLLLVICAALGFALVTQVRAQREDPLESLAEEDLVVLLNELNTQEDALRIQRNELQSQLASLEAASSQQEAAQEAARTAQQQARISAGQAAVTGPGVVMNVVDNQASLTSTQFVMTLGELRNAGAEAIELNGHRLTVRSSFVSDESGIEVDGHKITSPYQWRVIGASGTISTALEIQAGSAAQMRAKGATVSISEEDSVLIESTVEPLVPQYASVD
ncbi:DUF881 domain-containing protein [Schaalia vaccimaxillae]|uniref:DUF881 domain-containing protein n=1 Tax=Schaalia vaccimaxillae TaxID=183916 RepID=UPI0003B537AA|nr:DUF881 domain-containing protein [Schaalia vaccimaxillae]